MKPRSHKLVHFMKIKHRFCFNITISKVGQTVHTVPIF